MSRATSVPATDEATVAKFISSAGMTADWRSRFPVLSGDALSGTIVSDAERVKATEYCDKRYPHAALQMSIRAGFCFSQCIRLLETGEYDSVVSFGSGFSMLTLTVAEALLLAGKDIAGLTFVDSDLPGIVEARTSRVAANADISARLASLRMQTMIMDLEEAARSGLALNKMLPTGCNKPIFVAEGLIYFLSLGCQSWLFGQMRDRAQFPASACVFDYWPENSVSISRIFREQVVPFFAEATIAESVKELMPADRLEKEVKAGATEFNDVTLAPAEVELRSATGDDSKAVFPALGQDEYIPLHMVGVRFG